MKKLKFVIFIFFISLLPLICLRLADNKGAITDPIEKPSELVYLLNPEITNDLSQDYKDMLLSLTRGVKIKTINSNTGQEMGTCGIGLFKLVFYNNTYRDDAWYKCSFIKQSGGVEYSIKLKTGIQEKLIIEKAISSKKTVLFEHLIPLRQNEYNTLLAIIVDKRMLIVLNKRISFNLLLQDDFDGGHILFRHYIADGQKPCQAGYREIQEDIKPLLISLLNKIPVKVIQ